MKTRDGRGRPESGRVNKLEVSLRLKDIYHWGYVIKWAESWKMVSQSGMFVFMSLKVVALLTPRSQVWLLCVVEVKWKKGQRIKDHEESERPERWISIPQACLRPRMRTGVKWERRWARFKDRGAVTRSSTDASTAWRRRYCGMAPSEEQECVKEGFPLSRSCEDVLPSLSSLICSLLWYFFQCGPF